MSRVKKPQQKLREIKFLNKMFIEKKVFSVAQKELVCVLSLQLRPRLVKSIEQNFKFCSLNVIFQSPCKLHTLFKFKDSLDKKIRSDLIYRNTCSNCNVTYYGKTYRHFFFFSEPQNKWEFLT